jgi:hypothetical protein
MNFNVLSLVASKPNFAAKPALKGSFRLTVPPITRNRQHAKIGFAR